MLHHFIPCFYFVCQVLHRQGVKTQKRSCINADARAMQPLPRIFRRLACLVSGFYQVHEIPLLSATYLSDLKP